MNQDDEPKDGPEHFPNLGKWMTAVGIAALVAVLIIWSLK